MSIPLVKTKLNIPPKRPNLVPRPRLMMVLDEAIYQQRRLILVSAKAGSGKTTLTSAWLQQQERPAAWLALDANDNDPRRFCGYLVAALQQLEFAMGPAVLDQLEIEPMPQAEDLMGTMINELADQAGPCLLVLDDFHLI